ncbi:MAG: FAD-binding protein, partial [Pseudomonadota bacterium]
MAPPLASPSPELLAHLAERLGPQGFLGADDDRVAPYLVEPRDEWQGRAACVVKPGDVGEVSAVLAACNAARVPVIAISGGTGLVGGQMLPEGPLPVILSLERMNRIREVSPDD